MRNFRLKKFQLEALGLLEQKNHLVLIASTGSGKSLIFQKYLHHRRTQMRAVLISPLNALARQHADRLKSFEVPVFLGIGKVKDDPPIGPGVWILNPESLSERVLQHLREWRPNFLIVDECHCIWDWGAEFRPEFKKVLNLVKELSIPQSFWCTATLPQEAKVELLENLPKEAVCWGEFELPKSLKIERLQVPSYSRIDAVRSLLNQHATQSGIVFASTRKATERICAYLKFWERPCVFYHAGMSQEERVNLEKQIEHAQENSVPLVIVATSAFGMGMDYPSLQFCILFEASFNLLSLAQSLGRVGRADRPSQAYALWSEDDFSRYDWVAIRAKGRNSEIEYLKEWYRTRDCHHAHLQKYFNAEYL